MKHLYRKRFEHAHDAELTATGFTMPGVGFLGPIDVSTHHEENDHWVYLSFEGEYDVDELFAATGYKRVD